MSLATWKKEFYSKSADKTTEAESLEHSIKKWEGATPTNLKKHNVFRKDVTIMDRNNDLNFTDETCALCYHYLDHNEDIPCQKCPLYKSVGVDCGDDESPYDKIREQCFPVSKMINALKKARKFHHVKVKTKIKTKNKS